MDKIFFWAERDEYGWMSNFWPGPFQIKTFEGSEIWAWPTTEHYFAAMKTTDPELQAAIRSAATPLAAKRMGRALPIRGDWEMIRFDVMLTALRSKFGSQPFKEKLLATGDALIYEDSPFDKIWGTGVRGDVGKGQNLLGKALMKVREELKKDGI